MKYLILLRGVNVGGNNKVGMKELKEALEGYFSDVMTYINSGNIIINSPFTKSKTVQKIKEILSENYSFPIPFVLIDKEEYLREFYLLPEWFFEEYERKNILFYLDSLDKESTINEIKNYSLNKEAIFIGDLGIYWAVMEKYGTSVYHGKLLKTKWYKHVTVRNFNTFIKLKELMEK